MILNRLGLKVYSLLHLKWLRQYLNNQLRYTRPGLTLSFVVQIYFVKNLSLASSVVQGPNQLRFVLEDQKPSLSGIFEQL